MLQTVKRKLAAQKENILKMVRKEHDDTVGDVGDEVDYATQTLEKELLFELTDNERQLLERIENALEKIDSKQYGLCESCKKKIPNRRLEAIPSARYCIGCQVKMEKST